MKKLIALLLALTLALGLLPAAALADTALTPEEEALVGNWVYSIPMTAETLGLDVSTFDVSPLDGITMDVVFSFDLSKNFSMAVGISDEQALEDAFIAIACENAYASMMQSGMTKEEARAQFEQILGKSTETFARESMALVLPGMYASLDSLTQVASFEAKDGQLYLGGDPVACALEGDQLTLAIDLLGAGEGTSVLTRLAAVPRAEFNIADARELFGTWNFPVTMTAEELGIEAPAEFKGFHLNMNMKFGTDGYFTQNVKLVKDDAYEELVSLLAESLYAELTDMTREEADAAISAALGVANAEEYARNLLDEAFVWSYSEPYYVKDGQIFSSDNIEDPNASFSGLDYSIDGDSLTIMADLSNTGSDSTVLTRGRAQ